jgi:hypothetical protein
MSKNTPPNVSEPLIIESISIMPPNVLCVILASYHHGSSSNPFGQPIPTKDEFLEEREGATIMAEKIIKAEQRKASKAKEREGGRGQCPCDPQESDLKMF